MQDEYGKGSRVEGSLNVDTYIYIYIEYVYIYIYI